jgi:hypothetical protein
VIPFFQNCHFSTQHLASPLCHRYFLVFLERKTAYEFAGNKDSYIEIPQTKNLDTQYSMTLLAAIFPTGKDGPVLHYTSDKWGVHFWQYNQNQLFVRFVRRDGVFTEPLAARVLQVLLKKKLYILLNDLILSHNKS